MCDPRRRTVAGVAVMVTAAAMTLAAAARQAGGAAEQAVLQAENDRFAAMKKADAAALEKLLAPELSYTHSNASVQDKAAFISDIKSGRIKYLTIDAADMKARIFGSMAIVTGGATVHVIQNGNDLNIKIRYTDVHINRGGSWQMVAWQSTRLPA
jgi:Domain of unknown function (DUF4440)